MAVTIQKEHTGDRATQLVQRQTQKVANVVNALPFSGGVVVKGQQFTTGGVLTVQHNLGRRWTGYFLVRVYTWASGSPAVWDGGYLGDDRDKAQIGLTPFGTFTADVYIY